MSGNNNKACKESTEGEGGHVLELNLDFSTGCGSSICITPYRVFSQLAQAAQRSSRLYIFFLLCFPSASVRCLLRYSICFHLCVLGYRPPVNRVT